MSTSVFWVVLPSLALFVALPPLLRSGVNFYLSLSISISVTILCYWLMVGALWRQTVKCPLSACGATGI